MNAQKKIAAIILFITLLLTGFYLRHFDVEVTCLNKPATIEYCIASPVSGYSWDKILPAQLFNIFAPAVFVHALLAILFHARTCRRENYIGRCNKKMVKAIMLQFHPA